MNDIATHFLTTYAAGGEVQGGWKFGKALLQAKLDYTPESLNRLDQLLTQIRERAKPTRSDLDAEPGRNLCALIAFYLIEVVRRRTGAEIAWQDRQTAVRAMPDAAKLPEAPATRLLAHALDQGAIFIPLGWVEAQLLPSGKYGSAADFIANVIQQLERDAPSAWFQATYATGRIASWQMMMAADGGVVMPMMLRETAPMTFISGMPGADVDGTLQHYADDLENNPERAKWQVLSYDGFVEDKGGRIDAVIVMAYTYGEKELRMKLAFPYKPAQGGRRFAILQPMLRGANIEPEKVSLLNEALERGIQSVNWSFGTTWNELRER